VNCEEKWCWQAIKAKTKIQSKGSGMRKWWWFCVWVQWRDGYGFGCIKVVDGDGESRGR